MTEFRNIPFDDSACPELVARLWERDTTLWSGDPEVQRRIENRLGWLDAARFMDQHNAGIDEFSNRVRTDGFRQVVLLGMGGSSLAPEVYATLFENAPRALALTVVDSTSPEHISNITAQCETAPTLFIISSKSGTTAETSALDAHFFDWARVCFERPQDHFVAITDPGSPLQSLAEQRGYRKVFLNPPDIGGRFSGLSFFGLVPAALAGANLDSLRAQLPDASAAEDACRLGIVLGSLATQGKNKLALQISPTLAPMAAWIEQLIDESTGKNGLGIVVIPDERRHPPETYSDDRVFALVEYDKEPVDSDWLQQLTNHGHPVVRWRVARLEQLGAEFFKWEIATAIAGHRLGINPFDEPDVNDSKARTLDILKQAEEAPVSHADSVSAMHELLRNAQPGDYLAVLAYLPPSRHTRERLEAFSTALNRHSGLPCCVSFGPRYLHSSGQLHKGGPNQGIFVVITHDSGLDVPIPGQRHGFRSLIHAQADGDFQVLKDRGRRVVHFRTGDSDAELEELIASFRL